LIDPSYHVGQTAPSTGLYRIFHYQHRLPHNAVLRAGDVFPACHRCGERVTFQLSTSAEPVLLDPDFELEQAS
jgi:hypothetical protein